MAPRSKQAAPSLLRRFIPTDDEEIPPHPTMGGTAALLFGLASTWATLPIGSPSFVARYAALGVGISLVVSVAIDARLGLRNLIRADLMMLASLFFLTLFEFLTPQADFDSLRGAYSIAPGLGVVLLGFAGLAVGRHGTSWTAATYLDVFQRPVSTGFIMAIFWICMAIGFLHILIAVNFDPFEMVRQMMGPRFSQPWGRGKFGDWKALINELGLLLYVVPAIAGVVLAKPQTYSRMQRLCVLAGLTLVMFQGFSSGTRNIFASYLATFMIGYAFSLKREEIRKLVAVAVIVAVLLVISTRVMLEFRTIGLGRYLKGEMEEKGEDEQSFFVDYNLYVICCLVELYPARYQYLGWEIPYLALIRPIPRAIWPSKPEGMSTSIEDALGAEGLTLASSFVGEAYISGGWAGVVWAGLFFGFVAGWWGRMASPRNSDFGTLVFASGFFAAVISMRSLLVFTTAVLPTIGAIVLGQFLINRIEQARIPGPARRQV
jgi:hypothetical protein